MSLAGEVRRDAVQIAETILRTQITEAPPTKGVDAETVALILAAG